MKPLLNCIYDLSHAPVSYDFCAWLFAADGVRRALGYEHMHVVIVPADTESGFRNAGKKLTQAQRLWRLHNLMVPLIQLFDASYTLLLGRGQLEIFDDGRCDVWPSKETRALDWFTPGFLVALHQGCVGDTKTAPRHLNPQPQALEWIDKHLPHEFITITRRNTLVPSRNSNQQAWDGFAKWARFEFDVVNIPDTDDACEAAHLGGNDAIGALAAVNPMLRYALYSRAKMNLGVNTGPMALCWLTRLPYLMFKLVAPDWLSVTPEGWQANLIPVGSQPPWAVPGQRFIWASDDFQTICAAFTEAMAQREAA